MKLRNKNTREIREADARGDGIYLLIGATGRWWKYELHRLASDWEYYVEPKEPLIKDEIIREAVRTWAAAANVKTDKMRVSKGTFFTSFIGWIDGLVGGLEISFRTGDAFKDIKDGAEVTLAELCGEED